MYGIDHYAHGQSDGVRGLITDFNILHLDFVEFAKLIQSKHANVPTYVFSHSLGTLVAILSVDDIPGVKGLLLSAPPIHSGSDAASPFGIKCLYPVTQTALGRGIAIYFNVDYPRSSYNINSSLQA